MGERHFAHTSLTAHLNHVLPHAVPPSPFVIELLGDVLGVVNDQIGAFQKSNVAAILLIKILSRGGYPESVRLMVANIDNNRIIRLNPKAECGPGMVQELR